MSFEQELVDLEERFWYAGGDGAFYEEHFADDGVVVLSEALGILEKPDVVAAIDSGDPWEAVDMTDVHVVGLGDGVAAVAYRATGRRPGAEPYRATISSVYVKRDDRWQLAVHQQTPAV